MSDAPTVGAPAPEIILSDQHGQLVSPVAHARDAGSAVLLVFYPFAFSGTCTGELCSIRDDIGAFANDGVQVMGVSCDPVHSLRAWADAEGFAFPLLSDFWPHGEAARTYGVFFESKGMATRGTFLLDSTGTLRWSLVNGPGEARDPQAHRDALATL